MRFLCAILKSRVLTIPATFAVILQLFQGYLFVEMLRSGGISACEVSINQGLGPDSYPVSSLVRAVVYGLDLKGMNKWQLGTSLI